MSERPDSPAMLVLAAVEQLNAKLDTCEALLRQILDALGAQSKGGGLGH